MNRAVLKRKHEACVFVKLGNGLFGEGFLSGGDSVSALHSVTLGDAISKF